MLEGSQFNRKYEEYFKEKKAWTFVNTEAKTQRE
jgi:hypothetical protein